MRHLAFEKFIGVSTLAICLVMIASAKSGVIEPKQVNQTQQEIKQSSTQLKPTSLNKSEIRGLLNHGDNTYT